MNDRFSIRARSPNLGFVERLVALAMADDWTNGARKDAQQNRASSSIPHPTSHVSP